MSSAKWQPFCFSLNILMSMKLLASIHLAQIQDIICEYAMLHLSYK